MPPQPLKVVVEERVTVAQRNICLSCIAALWWCYCGLKEVSPRCSYFTGVVAGWPSLLTVEDAQCENRKRDNSPLEGSPSELGRRWNYVRQGESGYVPRRNLEMITMDFEVAPEMASSIKGLSAMPHTIDQALLASAEQ